MNCKCSRCGMREATTEVRIQRNDRVETMYLCKECAEEYRNAFPSDSFDMLNKLVYGSPMGLLSGLGLFNAPAARTMICPHCKTTSEQFLKTGFVGCPHCYETFETIITQTVKRLQQSDTHVGKTPYGVEDRAAEEERLKAELRAAVDERDYAKICELGEKLKRIVGNKGGDIE